MAEVIINQGILMDLEMVEEYHQFLINHLKAPFSLLINKKYDYTYTFEAQKKVGALDEINRIAVIVESFIAKKSTEFLIAINEPSDWNIRIFNDRNSALNWVENEG
ncbi:hypothetical protein [Winogradskyella endarachnes]|uniref:hypothetical protein n=1 Tax=Winogradskyella endarachnes TaxID=2681965 RepID=UPI0018D20863|nr:hypothetical protein [Winogradskyella endarachnes]